MDFRSITVKECFDNPKAVAIIKEMAPSIMKYPICRRRRPRKLRPPSMKFSDAHQQKISPAAEAAGAYFEYENAAPFPGAAFYTILR